MTEDLLQIARHVIKDSYTEHSTVHAVSATPVITGSTVCCTQTQHTWRKTATVHPHYMEEVYRSIEEERKEHEKRKMEALADREATETMTKMVILLKRFPEHRKIFQEFKQRVDEEWQKWMDEMLGKDWNKKGG